MFFNIPPPFLWGSLFWFNLPHLIFVVFVLSQDLHFGFLYIPPLGYFEDL